MDKDQATYLKNLLLTKDSSGKYICRLFRFQDGTGTMHDSRSSFIDFDLTNELVVCVRTNTDHYTQVAAPFAVIFTTFGDTQNLELYVNKDNIMQLVNLAMPGASAETKAEIEKWVKTIDVSNLDNPDERPYYEGISPSIGSHNYAPKIADYVENTDVGQQGYFDN